MPLGLILASKLWTWIRHMGGPGLLLLGLADNSIIPMPGSMDVLTIYLVVHNRKHWYYYAAMALAGSIVGGYITYRLARKGGKEMLEHRMGPQRTKSIYARFERWGFWAIFVPAMLPPPIPFVPFLLAAGAMQYSRQKFLAALAPWTQASLRRPRLPRRALRTPLPALLQQVHQADDVRTGGDVGHCRNRGARGLLPLPQSEGKSRPCRPPTCALIRR